MPRYRVPVVYIAEIQFVTTADTAEEAEDKAREAFEDIKKRDEAKGWRLDAVCQAQEITDEDSVYNQEDTEEREDGCG